MTDRELLKEARDAFEEITFVQGEHADMNEHAEIASKMMCRIDAALAAPELDAMEIVRQVRKITETTVCDHCGLDKSEHIERDFLTMGGEHETYLSCPDSFECFFPKFDNALSETEAAAMIEQYGRRVPRAIRECSDNLLAAINANDCEKIQEVAIELRNIIIKYGVKIEEDKDAQS